MVARVRLPVQHTSWALRRALPQPLDRRRQERVLGPLAVVGATLYRAGARRAGGVAAGAIRRPAAMPSSEWPVPGRSVFAAFAAPTGGTGQGSVFGSARTLSCLWGSALGLVSIVGPESHARSSGADRAWSAVRFRSCHGSGPGAGALDWRRSG